MREKIPLITDRFADLPGAILELPRRVPVPATALAYTITVGYQIIKPASRSTIPRMIRLMEVLLHGGSTLSGSTAKQIHQAVSHRLRHGTTIYGLNQLRYDLRKIKAHGLLQRDGKRYAYRLTRKGLGCRSAVSVLPQAPVRTLWRTAASIINPTPLIAPIANSKLLTTRPTRQFKRSSICWPPPDVTSFKC